MSCLNAGISRATAELTVLTQQYLGPQQINHNLDFHLLLQEVAPAQPPQESNMGSKADALNPGVP
jgi:hypothetical protein